MEDPRLIGIKFRSSGHIVWFIMSCVILLLIVFIYFLTYKVEGQLSFRYFPTGFVMVYHGSVFVTATFATRFGKINGLTYSVDCIWFNALMVAVHFLAFKGFQYFIS